MIDLTNLMLGDYVICNGKVCRVKEVGGMACVATIDEEEELFCNAEDIEPIPLTVEVIAKNKMKPFPVDPFKDCATAKWWAKDASFYIKQYHFKHNDFKAVYTFGCHPHTRVEGIRFIHQLQHAMKLCGIEKEIKL